MAALRPVELGKLGAAAEVVAGPPAPPPPVPVTTAQALAPAADEKGTDDEEITGSVAQILTRVPLPRLRIPPPAPVSKLAAAKAKAPVIRVAASAPAAAAHADGTFVGSVENAYYGLVQVEAHVAQGKLVSVRVLRYPSDRRTSVYINSRALPVLRREAIAAQGANVDIVSGATLTSRAFVRSLDAALNRAGA